MFRHTRRTVTELLRALCEGCQKRISCVQWSRRSGHIPAGDTLILRTMSIGTTADSSIHTCGYSGKSHRCCMTTADSNSEIPRATTTAVHSLSAVQPRAGCGRNNPSAGGSCMDHWRSHDRDLEAVEDRNLYLL